MISLIEQSAVNLLAGKLDEGQTTVGTNLNIAHVSATPVGGTIKCHCSLTEIDRKRLVFHVEELITKDVLESVLTKDSSLPVNLLWKKQLKN